MKPGKVIAKATIMDRGIYHWMNDQGTACIWGIAEMTDALSDVLLKNRFTCSST